MKQIFYIVVFFSIFINRVSAQEPVEMDDAIQQHIFSYGEIEALEDTTGKLQFNSILSPFYRQKFKAGKTSTPQAINPKSVYWYRIKINRQKTSAQNWLLEFFDQTIDDLSAYIPQQNNRYKKLELGDKHPFKKRFLQHKNFELPIDPHSKGIQTYYFRIQSHERADVIIVLRSVGFFIGYALNEYFTFGIFYGMILVFSFYNLLMFAAMRQKQYLYYVWYLLSVALYELSIDGLAYHYLWPNLPQWNQFAFGVALYMTSISALLFTRKLLFVPVKSPLLNKLILGTIFLRTVFFIYCLFVDRSLFNYKFIEFIPLSIAFFTGVFIYQKGYRPARFFVVGYGCLFVGFLMKVLIMLHISWLNTGAITYYSLTIAFILEMIFLSIAIGDKVRLLKKKKETAQRRVIRQMEVNERLSNKLNHELKSQVEERTHEVILQAKIIEQKNLALIEANARLQHQSDEILRMNAILEQDNIELQTSVEKVAKARALSADVSFEEFSKTYPDNETCYAFLADLKWREKYACRKCGETHHFHGHLPHSRRCPECGYEESVTSHTVFQNTRIDLNKAFYMVFMIYNSNGKISSHKLSEILGIRQSTCWAYCSRIKKTHDRPKKGGKNSRRAGLEPPCAGKYSVKTAR